MKSHALPTFALLASVAFATPLAAAGPGKPTDPPCNGLSTYMATLPVAPLSDVEKAGLLFTREEHLEQMMCIGALSGIDLHRMMVDSRTCKSVELVDAHLFMLACGSALGRSFVLEALLDSAPRFGTTLMW